MGRGDRESSGGAGAAVAVVVAILILAAIAAVALGAFGTTRSVEVQSPAVVVDPPADGASGIVFNLRSSGGLRIFGIQFRPDTYEAHISAVVPSECVGSDGMVLRADGACADLPVQGELSGGGTTADGRPFVFVRVEVSKECYETLSVGERWPSEDSACAEQ